MDPRRFKEAYEKLQVLDERLTHRLRPARGSGMHRPGTEQLEEQVRMISDYVVQLKEVVGELMLALGTRPRPEGEPPPG